MKQRSPLLVIFLTVFIDLIGFGICLPLLPKYAELFGGMGWQIGAVMGIYSLMQLVFAPGWGQLSDRIGRRPVLLISLAGSVISYALFGFSALFSGEKGFWILIASRAFAGVCGANLGVASAYIADVTSPQTRSKGMGMIGMAFGLGFILGPVIGSLSYKWLGLSGPGWVAAVICTINFILACFILTESRQPLKEKAPQRARLNQIQRVFALPGVGFLIGIYFLATFAFTSFETTLPLLLGKRLGLGEDRVGYVFAYCGLMAALVQGGAIGRLVKSFGERRLIGGSLIVVAVSLSLIAFAGTLTVMLAALAVFAIGSGINRAPTMGLISQLSPEEEQGSTLSVAQSAGTLARVIGPVFATTLYAKDPRFPYLACAVVALLAGMIAMRRLISSNRRPSKL